MRTGFTLFCLAGLAALLQAQTPLPRELALQAEVEALIARHVEGDPEAAAAALRRGLATAASSDRPRLLAALALLLDRMGRAPEALPLLEELRAAPAPFGPWATARLGSPPPGPPADPVGALIDLLDTGSRHTEPVLSAFKTLKELGPLAVPALAERLDRLGPLGLVHALELLKTNPDPRMYPALEALLRSPDPGRQLAAGKLLKHLPLHERANLAAVALEATDPQLRIEAAESLAEDRSLAAPLLAVLTTLARHPDPELRRRVVLLLGGWSREAGAEARALLETLVLDPHERVHRPAIEAWIDSSSKEEEPQALELQRKIEVENARSHFAVQAYHLRQSHWNAVHVASLPDLLRMSENSLQLCLTLLRERQVQVPPELLLEIFRHPRPDFQSSALSTLESQARLGSTDAKNAPILEAIWAYIFSPISVGHRGMRDDALRFLIQHAPCFLAEHMERVLAELYGHRTAYTLHPFLLEHGDGRAVRRVVEHWKTFSANPSDVAVMHDIIIRRSDPSNLVDLLGLVGIPNQYSASACRELRLAVEGALDRWFAPSHISEVLPRIRRIDYEIAERLLVRISTTLGPDQEPEIMKAIEEAFTGLIEEAQPGSSGPERDPTPMPGTRMYAPIPKIWVAQRLIPALGRSSTERAAEFLEKLWTETLEPVPQDERLQELRSDVGSALLSMRQADHARILRRILAEESLWPLINIGPFKGLLEQVFSKATPAQEPELLRLLDLVLQGLFEDSPKIPPFSSYSKMAESLISILRGSSSEQAAERLEHILAANLDPNERQIFLAPPDLRFAALDAILSMEQVDHARVLRRVLLEDPLAILLPSALGHPLVAEEPELRKQAASRIKAAWSHDPWQRKGYQSPTRTLDVFLSRLPAHERKELAASLIMLHAGNPRSPSIMLSALGALGDFKDAAFAETLAAGLKHTDQRIRSKAVFELRRTFAPDAVPFLLEAMKDDYPNVRKAAADAIEEIQTYLRIRREWEESIGKPR